MNNTDKMVNYDFQLKRFRKYLKALRLTIGCSGAEFASLLEIGRGTFQKYEKDPECISPLFYLAFRGLYFDYSERVTHTQFYQDLWFALIEGLDEDGHDFPEKDADAIAEGILRIGNDHNKCPQKYGTEYAGSVIRRELFGLAS